MACGCGLIGSPITSAGTTLPVYSNPAGRGGESALFVYEVFEMDATNGINVTVEHKNRGDTSWAVLATTTAPITAAGVLSMDMSGFKEQYRIAVAFQAGTSTGDTVRIGNMNFAWRPY
jgi:hypothetical protein